MKKKVLFFIGAILILNLVLISANQIEIDLKSNYNPGENLNIKLVLYDDNFNKINGEINYQVLNFYSEVMSQGKIASGEVINYNIPNNAQKGHWAIIATNGEIEKKELFNVMDGEKVEIKLEDNYLVISNLGNTQIVNKQISISIGDYSETAFVSLEIGQIKRIKLTAPEGEYTIKVSDGTKENTFEVAGVSLTGNVIGLQSVINGNFFQRYPVMVVFIGALIAIFVFISVMKIQKKYNDSKAKKLQLDKKELSSKKQDSKKKKK